MRLRVLEYSMGEYLHILGNGGLTLKYKTYSIVSQENNLEELKKKKTSIKKFDKLKGGGGREKKENKKGNL